MDSLDIYTTTAFKQQQKEIGRLKAENEIRQKQADSLNETIRRLQGNAAYYSKQWDAANILVRAHEETIKRIKAEFDAWKAGKIGVEEYYTVKAERDRLKAENERLKEENKRMSDELGNFGMGRT